MTKEEILKAADDAVEMFKMPIDESDFHVPENITGVSHSSDEYAKVLESETNSVALQGAIIHYEKIVERDEFWFKNMRETMETILKHFKVPVSSINSPLLEDSKAILQELKSRL